MIEIYEHNPQEHEDPVARPVALVGFLGAVLLLITLLGVTALYYNVKAEKVDQQVVRIEFPQIQKLRSRQEELLSGPPRWIERDEQGDTVDAFIIPIDRAIELIVQEASSPDALGVRSTGDRP